MLGIAGGAGRRNSRNVTSALAMTPPCALVTRPFTVAFWADAAVEMSAMKTVAKPRRYFGMSITFTVGVGHVSSVWYVHSGNGPGTSRLMQRVSVRSRSWDES